MAQPLDDLPDQPGPAVAAAANHDAISSRLVQCLVHFVEASYVAIGDDRNADPLFHFSNGVVFGLAHVLIATRAAMNGDEADAGGLGDARNRRRVACGAIPARGVHGQEQHVACGLGRLNAGGHESGLGGGDVLSESHWPDWVTSRSFSAV